MANQTQVSLLRICTFRHIVPLIFLWGERPRAQRRKFHMKWPTKFNFRLWKSALFVKSSSHFSMRWEKPRAQLRTFHKKWPTKLNFLLWKSAIVAKSSPSFFYEMRKAARAQRGKFSIYNWFSYGFLNRTARAARKLFQYITHFSYGFHWIS